MIIIEGTDGTGKTTLAKALIAHLKLSHQSYVHVSQPPPGATWPAWTQYTEMIRSSLVPSNGIIDRFIYGESVYGPIMRCDHRFTAAYRRMLERVLLNRRTVVVFCKPPYEWARKNWDQRNQQGGEYVTKTELHRQTYDRFIEVMAAAHLPVVTFDPTKDTVQQVICRLIAAKPPINPGPGYGWYEKGVTLLRATRSMIMWALTDGHSSRPVAAVHGWRNSSRIIASQSAACTGSIISPQNI